MSGISDNIETHEHTALWKEADLASRITVLKASIKLCYEDVMWANHSEISKNTLARVHYILTEFQDKLSK